MFRRLALLGVLMGGGCPQALAGGSSALLEEVRRTSVKAGPLLPLTKEKFQLMTFAQEMNVAVFNDWWDMHDGGIEGLYGNAATYYEDDLDVDAMLTLDAGDYCFVSWRGTKSSSNFDNISNGNVVPFPAQQLDGLGQCTVTGGSYGAYMGSTEIESSITQFVESCMAGPNKQLVLTGHSQGAGACVVGAIRFAGYTPLTIPIAVPPIVLSACDSINPDHMWRVDNTELDHKTGVILYDSVSYQKMNLMALGQAFLGRHFGASIHLPPDTPHPLNETNPRSYHVDFTPKQYNVAYFSKDQITLEETYGPGRGDLSSGNDVEGNWGVHSMYNLKMYDILANAEFPLDVSGYIPGTQCTGDEECQFECIDNVCAQEGADLLPDGAMCAEHNDCASGDCSGCVMNIGGDWCCTGSDSDSGATPNGGECQQDGNCVSDRCTWDYICAAKLEAGARCQNNGDCVSGTCNWSYTCASPSYFATVNGAGVVQI